jgi:hypothetical protein
MLLRSILVVFFILSIISVISILDDKKNKTKVNNINIPVLDEKIPNRLIYTLRNKFVGTTDRKKIDNIIEKFHTYSHQFYDVEDMTDYIILNFEENYIETFYKLSVDEKFLFFNLCKLYNEGGTTINFKRPGVKKFIKERGKGFDLLDSRNITSEKGNIYVDLNLKKMLKNGTTEEFELDDLKIKRPNISNEWLNFMIETNTDFLKNRIQNNEIKGSKTSFLIRSYRRPEYLKKCLQSIKNMNLDIFYEKIILDDFSNDIEMIELYNEFKKLGFHIKVNSINYVERSFSKILGLVDKNSDYVLYIDNDIVVKDNIYEVMIKTYKNIKNTLKIDEDKILLTSFDTENHKVIEKYKYFKEKQSIGGANKRIRAKFSALIKVIVNI